MFKTLSMLLLKVLPAFSWWVPYTIKKRNFIIAAIKSCLEVSTHKYGVEIPSFVEYSICLDAINWNQLLQESLDKEMHNVSVAFEILPTGAPVPVGWKKSSGHLIWYLKIYFTQKSCWFKDGHRTPDSKESNYSGVVSRYSVYLPLLVLL